MTRPDTPYEAASYDLNKFRERRMEDRRLTSRTTADRRGQPIEGSLQGAHETPACEQHHPRP